jgi:ATP diphosphatase
MSLNPLEYVLDELLGPNGCPWDKKQTPQSLCDYLVEECFELTEAIRTGKPDDVAEEMGDVFFLLYFVLRLYRDQGLSEKEVLDQAAAKMIRRHPHVFSDCSINSIKELWDNWEQIKRQEKQESHKPTGPFDSLPASLPPLLRAYRINSKAARSEFTWESDSAQESSLHKEWDEWLKAMADKDQESMEEEFGDYLFSLVEYGRRRGIKANTALARANTKFLARYATMQEMASDQNLNLHELDMEAKNRLWEKAKVKLSGFSSQK